MSAYGFGKLQPGHTLHVGMAAEPAAQVIAQAYEAEGLRYESAPGAFPIQLARSSILLSSLIETVFGVLPLFLVPAILRKWIAFKVRIRVLEHTPSSATVRVDMTDSTAKELAFKSFQKPLLKAVDALSAQGVAVEMEPLTDSAREKRPRRKDR